MSKKIEAPQIEVSQQFKDIFALLESTTDHVFITGRAGTGKSTFLQLFRAETRKNIVVVAPTGVAAVNVKGETIHSFFKFKPDVTIDKARDIARKATSNVYKMMEVLVIDEVSMVRADLMDCIDEFLKITRQSFMPFGGVQLALIGDLYQLPPVLTRQDKEHLEKVYKTPFFFSAQSMNNIHLKVVELEKIYRQTEVKFVELLNRVRDNSVTEGDIIILNSRYKKDIKFDDTKMNVFLTSTNALAATINVEEMNKLASPEFAFKGHLTGDFERTSLPTDEIITLKVGAQVMMINNDPQSRWINGTIGKVVHIEKDKDGDLLNVELQDGTVHQIEPNNWDMYEFVFDEEQKKLVSKPVGSFSQYPLKLAWAITIHKSQGKTFDTVIIDFGNGAFAPGQVYVALSRARTLGGITLRTPIRRRDIWTDKSINEFMQSFSPAKK